MAVAQQQDVPITLHSVGNVSAISEVMLRPEVAAQILDAPAGEGTDVNAGDVVVRLDPRPFQAALNEAQAALARHEALAKDAHKQAQALHDALVNKATSTREAEQAEANAVAADAQVVQDQATIETAKVNLDYCTIRAPFSGRLGALMVKPGAVVKVGETDLISLTQIAPIEVTFAMPEEYLASIRAAAAVGPVPTQVQIPGDAGTPVSGTLSFIDNKVDTMTGSVRLKAHFDNTDRRLWPGQFVNVTITTGVEKNAVIVPSAAVQASQKGQSIFVVKPDQSVELRTVAARIVNSIAIVTQGVHQGVQAGETVVTDGQIRLVPGSKVVAKDQSKKPTASPSASGDKPASSNPQTAIPNPQSPAAGAPR
jgi:multidrug efflux system membrane fusion protein